MVDSSINFISDSTSSINQVAISGFISELSLFLGVWDRKNLIEVVNLDRNDANGIQDLLTKYTVQEVNLVHDSGIFTHADFDSFDPLNFDKFFAENALKFKNGSDISSYEKLKQQKVFTLCYSPNTLIQLASMIHEKSKVHHISTAMANYSLDQPENILVLIGQNKLSLAIHSEGFKEFLQYDIVDGYDFLYFILLAAKKHDLDISKVPVKIGGNIDISSPLYQTLKAHIYNLTFCTGGKFTSSHADNPIHYYLPLMIARACG